MIYVAIFIFSLSLFLNIRSRVIKIKKCIAKKNEYRLFLKQLNDLIYEDKTNNDSRRF